MTNVYTDRTEPYISNYRSAANATTLLGVILAGVASYLLYSEEILISTGVLLLAYSMDVLDGKIARRGGQTVRDRARGTFLDGLADRVSDLFIFTALFLSPLFDALAVFLLAVLSYFALYLRSTLGQFRVFTKTFYERNTRSVSLIFTLLATVFLPPLANGIWIIVGLQGMALLSYVRKGIVELSVPSDPESTDITGDETLEYSEQVIAS